MDRLSLFPEQASTIAVRVDALFAFLVGVTVFFSLLIAGLIVWFMVRYRRREGVPPEPLVEGSLALEGFWTIVPFGIALVAFFWGASIYASLAHPPANALEVNVIGKQWMWKAQHLEGRQEINELHVPVGRPVRVTLTSEDVIHSFYVPAFRTKMDAVPGRYTTTWFEATRSGTYHLFCAEYCGTLHSGMVGRIVALEPAEFQAWLDGAGTSVPPAVAGERIFETQGCPTCHELEGRGGRRGPALAGLFGRTVRLEGGSEAVADETYLRESIVNPRARIVAGYEPIMPTYQGLVTEEDLMQLVAYVKSLPAVGKEP